MLTSHFFSHKMVEQCAYNAKENMKPWFLYTNTQTTLKYNFYKNQSSCEHASAHSLPFPEKTAQEQSSLGNTTGEAPTKLQTCESLQ